MPSVDQPAGFQFLMRTTRWRIIPPVSQFELPNLLPSDPPPTPNGVWGSPEVQGDHHNLSFPANIDPYDDELQREVIKKITSKGLNLKKLLRCSLKSGSGSRAITLNIEIQPTENRWWIETYIYALPWELLIRNTRHGCWGMREVSICRLVEFGGESSAPAGAKPARHGVAILASQAYRTNIESVGCYSPSIEKDGFKEIGEITEVVLRASSSGTLSRACCTKLTERLLTECGALKHDIEVLHLICHGELNSGRLGFQDPVKPTDLKWVDGGAFVDVLREIGLRPKVIYLSSCESARVSFSRSGLPQQLIKANMADVVIGFRAKIGSEHSAPRLARVFYEKYLENRRAVQAFSWAVTTEAMGAYVDAPVIYKRGSQ